MGNQTKYWLSAMVSVFSISLPAAAADDDDWVEIGNSNTLTMKINAVSIKTISGSIKSAWFKFEQKEKRNGGEAYNLVLERLNCADDTTATVSYISYAANGNVINSQNNSIYSLSWRPAAPGTLASTMLNVACKF